MRKPLSRNPFGRQIAIPRAIPAPVGGWNTEAALGAMKPQDAVLLDNFIPRSAKCEMRRGFDQQATGTADPVEALVVWRGAASGDKLFACTGAYIYDVTTAGALPGASWSSSTSARWEHTNFANDAGRFAILANGADTPLKYDGSAFAELTITGTAGVITLDPVDLRCPMVHKARLWFIEKETLRSWYLETNAIQGAATLLDLGPRFYKGGYLVAQGTWSLDSGAGMDDVAVFVTNEGQVAVFQGLDPTDPDNWSLVGVFDVARPIGNQPLVKWGADLAIITEDGLLPLSQALAKDRDEAKKIALTSKIATAFADASASYGSLYGWSAITYSGRGSLAIINVPTTELSAAQQFVQSIESGGWCRFTGLNAICWAQANGSVYFGGAVGVYEWDVGASDDGEVITADMTPAFSAFGNGNVLKKFTMVRSKLRAPSIVKPALEILTDYEEREPTAVQNVVAPGDVLATDANYTRQDWTSAEGLGYVGAPRLQITIVGSGDSDRLAIDGTDVLEISSGGGEHLITRADLPLDVPVEVIGFDVMFLAGANL